MLYPYSEEEAVEWGGKDLTLLDRTSTGTSPVCHTPHHSLFDPPGTYIVCQLLKAFGFAAVDLERFCVLPAKQGRQTLKE